MCKNCELGQGCGLAMGVWLSYRGVAQLQGCGLAIGVWLSCRAGTKSCFQFHKKKRKIKSEKPSRSWGEAQDSFPFIYPKRNQPGSHLLLDFQAVRLRYFVLVALATHHTFYLESSLVLCNGGKISELLTLASRFKVLVHGFQQSSFQMSKYLSLIFAT